MYFFRRAILILLIAILWSFCASAQKLECRDFKVTNEVTAHLKDTEVIDKNSGKRAALIKIFTPFQNEMLGFEAGLFQILDRKQAGPGEVWLYVPERTQKVTITHPTYQPTVMWFEGMEAESGKTYSVVLNVEGRNVALIASAPNAEISVDGEPQGKSPVNMYMPIGSHLVRAELGSLLFEDIITITADGANQFNLKMEDENLKYGDVDIEVAEGAELWFQDKMEGIGAIHKHLREGSYVVTAKLPNHHDQITAFNVEAGKTTKVIVPTPAPHMGYFEVITDPAEGVTVMEGDSIINLTATMQLPVDRYEYTFSKKGYHPQRLVFRITKDRTTRNFVYLNKIQYVKKGTMYIGASYTFSGRSSIGLTAGLFIRRVNIEGNYNLGLGRTKDVNWYDKNNNIFEGAYNYRVDDFTVRLGYLFSFAERFSLTPQVGVLTQRLFAHSVADPGHKYYENSVTVGARIAYFPVQHMSVVFTPEYGIPSESDGDGPEVFKRGGVRIGGFRASLGIALSL